MPEMVLVLVAFAAGVLLSSAVWMLSDLELILEAVAGKVVAHMVVEQLKARGAVEEEK